MRLFTFLVLLIAVTSAYDFTLYVDGTKGNDNNTGLSLDLALKSIYQGQVAARSISNNGAKSVQIFVRGGIYYFKTAQSLLFTPQDAFQQWTAYNKEKVIFSSGVQIPSSCFKSVDPATPLDIMSRINSTLLSKVKQCNMTSVGVDPEYKDPTNTPSELYYDGQVMTFARYQKRGQWLVGGAASANVLAYSDSAKIAEWAKERNPRAGGFFWGLGYFYALTVPGFDPTNSLVIINNLGNVASNSRFHVFNILSELDTPGEYYIDYWNNTVYMIPYSNINDSTIITVSQSFNTIGFADGTHDIGLDGFSFQDSRSSYLTATGRGLVSNLKISNCNFQGNGGAAATIYFPNAYNVSITGNIITDSGAGAITLSGGDRTVLTSGQNTITYNYISGIARQQITYNPAVLTDGVGTYIGHNTLENLPHLCISYPGNYHIIEYNVFNHIMWDVDDGGCLYLWEDMTSRGSVARYNKFVDVLGVMGYGQAMSFYQDGCTSGNIFHHNVVINGNSAVILNGGRDNQVYNNLFLRQTHDVVIITKAGERGNCGNIQDQLNKVPAWNNDIWAAAFPSLYNILTDDPYSPKGNNISCNIMMGTPTVEKLWDQGDVIPRFGTGLGGFINYGAWNPNIFVNVSIGDYNFVPTVVPDFGNPCVWSKIPFMEMGTLGTVGPKSVPRADTLPSSSPSTSDAAESSASNIGSTSVLVFGMIGLVVSLLV